MSADNWATCPFCLEQAESSKKTRQQLADDAYGKVPIEEFDALRAEAAKPVKVGTRFREDYEIYLDGKSVVVSYSGYCEVCNKGTEFSERHPMEYEKL